MSQDREARAKRTVRRLMEDGARAAEARPDLIPGRRAIERCLAEDAKDRPQLLFVERYSRQRLQEDQDVWDALRDLCRGFLQCRRSRDVVTEEGECGAERHQDVRGRFSGQYDIPADGLVVTHQVRK